VFLKACLNGSRTPGEHPALPLTPAELAADARRVLAAGADALHVHPREVSTGYVYLKEGAGRESLAPEPVAAALTAIREACPEVAVGVSTGAWIEPDVSKRVAQIEAWTVLPDFASVNLSEPGWGRVLAALLERGVSLEAGIWTPDDARRLLELTDVPWLRLLLEPRETDAAKAHALVDGIEAVLGDVLPDVPRLLHGTGGAAWAMLERAARSGYGSRVGLEDTLSLPTGEPAPENAALVAEARARSSGARRNLLS